MLPAAKPGAPRLADVLPAVLGSLRGARHPLGLPAVRSAVVVLVDGLGSANLGQAAGHARTIASGPRSRLRSGFPSTTAVALASLTTGTLPGTHGLVGYDALVPGVGVRNQLRDWGGAMDPATWQRAPTLLADVPSFAVNEPRFAESGFTRATLRGAQYLGARTIVDRVDATLGALERGTGTLVYCYFAEADRAGHEHGWRSGEWSDALESIDGAVAQIVARAPAGTGVLVTADHGMVDVPWHQHRIIEPSLLADVVHIAGEPRCLQLHVREGASVDDVAARWRGAHGDEAWIATRDELVATGWFGAVHPDVLPRIGDVLVAARSLVAFYASEDDPARGMIGQHGSLTSEELVVPLARLGAYA